MISVRAGSMTRGHAHGAEAVVNTRSITSTAVSSCLGVLTASQPRVLYASLHNYAAYVPIHSFIHLLITHGVQHTGTNIQ